MSVSHTAHVLPRLSGEKGERKILPYNIYLSSPFITILNKNIKTQHATISKILLSYSSHEEISQLK